MTERKMLMKYSVLIVEGLFTTQNKDHDLLYMTEYWKVAND